MMAPSPRAASGFAWITIKSYGHLQAEHGLAGSQCHDPRALGQMTPCHEGHARRAGLAGFTRFPSAGFTLLHACCRPDGAADASRKP